MKLFAKYNRINLLVTVIIFLLAQVAFYFLLREVLIGQVDDDLRIEKREIQTYIGKYNRIPEVIPVKDQHISYQLTDDKDSKNHFSTTRFPHEEDSYRQLQFVIEAGGQHYRATVAKSLEATEDIERSIITIAFVIILLALIISIITNRFALRRLWRPFYGSLDAMRNFKVGQHMRTQFPDTTIEEFKFMNDTLQQTTARAEADYLALKEFTENAAHELQTPLAIIHAKLDLLLQDEQLSQSQSTAMQGAYESIQKLSKLNQSLLLLTKIENRQYATVSEIDLSGKLHEKLVQFEEIIQSKDLHVTYSSDEIVFVAMNPMLADIILNNLLGNAIRYTPVGESINIGLRKGALEISNSAAEGALDETRLFRRFAKPGQVKDGTGLGLAIVKQAADVSGLAISYRYAGERHHFLVNW